MKGGADWNFFRAGVAQCDSAAGKKVYCFLQFARIARSVHLPAGIMFARNAQHPPPSRTTGLLICADRFKSAIVPFVKSFPLPRSGLSWPRTRRCPRACIGPARRAATRGGATRPTGAQPGRRDRATPWSSASRESVSRPATSTRMRQLRTFIFVQRIPKGSISAVMFFR